MVDHPAQVAAAI